MPSRILSDGGIWAYFNSSWNLFFVLQTSTKKNALHLSVNVFSTEELIGDTIFTSPAGDGTAILRGHPSHAKV